MRSVNKIFLGSLKHVIHSFDPTSIYIVGNVSHLIVGTQISIRGGACGVDVYKRGHQNFGASFIRLMRQLGGLPSRDQKQRGGGKACTPSPVLQRSQ